MNTGPLVGDWLRLAVVLGIELSAIAAACALLRSRCVPAAWRRLSLRGGLIAAVVMVAFELAGVAHWMAGWWAAAPANPQRVTIVSSNLDPAPELGSLRAGSVPATGEFLQPLPRPATPSVVQAIAPVWWPAWLWLGGAVVFAGRMLAARLVFAVGLRRRRGFCDSRMAERVSELARLLNMRRPVRVFELADLAAPISYGAFWPGIVLPARFARDHDGPSRDAMLLHELAHVAGRDGFWHGAADLVVACFWWHPAVWWMRREMEAASELAADEASVAVENGPRVLAECLVVMARRLTVPAGSGWQGIQGSRFRSRVGRRVERLLSLDAAPLPVRGLARRWIGRVAVGVLLGGLIFLGGFVTHRRNGDTGSWRDSWNASLGGMALSQLAAAEPAPTGPASTTAEPVEGIQWMPWSDAVVAEARAQGRTVLVIFSADWAVNSMVNEKVAIDIPSVRDRLRSLNTATFKADWTIATNAAIEAALKAYGKSSVPLTLVYAPDAASAPEVLPDALTPEIVLAALERAASAAGSATREPPATSTGNVSSPGVASVRQGSTLLFEAKALFDAGLLAEAKAKFSEILRDDPKSEAARHYLTLIDKARTSAAAKPGPRAPVNSRLDSIRLKSFGGTEALSAMVERLSREVRAADTSGHGVNFLVSSPALAIEDISSLYVQVDPPLRGATLRQILNAMVKGTGDSIRYSVEDYAVVFTGVAPFVGVPPSALHTRWLKIDPRTFVDAAMTGFDFSGRNKSRPSGEEVILAARRTFTNAGVDFTQPGKQLFFNDRLGMLMVRASLQELDIIEQAVQVLNQFPTQVTIEAKFCEVSGETLSALGFDWLLRHVGPREAPADDPSGGVSVAFGLPVEPEKLPQGPPAWIHAANVRPGILTESQAQTVFRALSQRRGVNVLSTPKVTTLSGRQAQIKVVEIRSVVTPLEPGQKYSGVTLNAGKNGNTSSNSLAVVETELGPVLDVVPYVSDDGKTIHLTLIATVKEFVGYDLDAARKLGAENPGGKPVTPAPVIRQRQVIASARVWDGQTVVLTGGEDKLDFVRSKNGEVGSIPPIGRLFRSQHMDRQKTNLVVLVTARIVDPAGNPVHPDVRPPQIPTK